ncbi:MAG: hypothetical protein JJT96_15815 [Opitutales bacterium]|nr:hypothetical protein [Opitutales bacterium]
MEAKVDEPFGQTLAEQLASALEDRMKNPRSMAFARAQQLVESVLGPRTEGAPPLKHIRYQLLTATAGALAEAKRKRESWGVDTVRVVVLIQEFVTSGPSTKKQMANARDLDRFLHRLTHGQTSSIEPGKLVGPLSVSAAPVPGIDLYFGKVIAPVAGPVV